MTKRFYLDTAIWRDYYENRSDRFRPLGEWALMFINKCIENSSIIIYSDLVIEELKVRYSIEVIGNILKIADKRNLLFKADISKSQIQDAKILSKTRNAGFADVLHAILARDSKAILITRDKHFLELTDIVETNKPEDLI